MYPVLLWTMHFILMWLQIKQTQKNFYVYFI